MRVPIYPYPTLRDKIELSISGARIGTDRDDDPSIDSLNPGCIVPEQLLVTVEDEMANGADYLELELRASIPASDLGTGVAAESLVVVAECTSTRMRQAARMEQDSPGESSYEASIRLDLVNYREKINVYCVMAGTATGLPDRYIGVSDTWSVLLDGITPPDISGSFSVKWASFGSDAERTFLHPYKVEPYYVHLAADEPVVYLNKGFEGLPELFPETGRLQGSQRALQESMSMSIARTVWLALFEAALSSVEAADADDEPLWPETPWQDGVLRMILPLVYPNLEEEQTLQPAVRARFEPDEYHDLISRAVAVIGHDILNEGKALRSAIRRVSSD